MSVKLFYKGKKFAICFWAESKEICQIKQYLTMLAESNNSDAASLTRLLQQTADNGLFKNEQKFRFLKGNGKGLVEFKARHGSRILGFIENEIGKIICTHAIPKIKPKKFDREIDKAFEIKNLYDIENISEENDYVH